jgi:hypothetical protein
MKTLFLPLFFLTGLLACSVSVFAQQKEFKFGKIDESELTAKVCPIDSSASAYIIGKFGDVSFEYNEHTGFQIFTKIHTRIKILRKNEESSDLCDISIPFYESGSSREKITDLKAVTYNLENGKLVATKLEKNTIKYENTTGNRRTIKFAFPAIKDGSVIELSYLKISDYYDIDQWYFQYSVPCLYSDFQVRIPEYFIYKQLSQGYVAIKNMNERNNSSLLIPGYDPITYTRTDYHSWGTNIPAMKKEPYTSCINDYRAAMSFELATVAMPYTTLKHYAKDWNSITDELLKIDHFGGTYDSYGFLKETAQKITAENSNEMQRVYASADAVKKQVKWDERNGMFATQSLKDTWKKQTGNAADVNFALIGLLRAGGFDAQPVIISTRDHGYPMIEYPMTDKFNYVIAAVYLKDTTLMVDATDPYCPSNILPERCLNDKGCVISDKHHDFLALTNNHVNSTSLVSGVFNLNAQGVLSGPIRFSYSGYEAIKERQDIASAKSQDEYIKSLKSQSPGITVTSSIVENKDSVDKPLTVKLEAQWPEFISASDGTVLFNPLMFVSFLKNPFATADRKYPVNFAYSRSYAYSFVYELPENYKVEELPKSAAVSLPNNAGRLVYTINSVGNKLMVQCRISINQVLFLSNDYASLRNFFNIIAEKLSQSVVLKKL